MTRHASPARDARRKAFPGQLGRPLINPSIPKHIDDPELGRLRYCRLCDEYWPADEEFFFKNGPKKLHGYCKACCSDRKRIHEPGRTGSNIGVAA